MPVDYEHPLHAASLFVEDIKYADGAECVVRESDDEEATSHVQQVLAAAGADADAHAIWLALAAPARRYAAESGAPVAWTRTMLADGLMHGVALGAGLRGHSPPGGFGHDNAVPALIVFGGGVVVIHDPSCTVDRAELADAIAAARLSSIDAESLAAALGYYGTSYARELGVPASWATRVFADGVMRGLRAVSRS